jgi:hypothetical protein
LSRASTTFLSRCHGDGRVKPGHDDGKRIA